MICALPGAVLHLITVTLPNAVFCCRFTFLFLSADVNVVSVSAELRPPEGHICLCYLSEDCH